MSYTHDLFAYTFQRAKLLDETTTPNPADGFFERWSKSRSWARAKHLLDKAQDMARYLDMTTDCSESESESDEETQSTLRSAFNAMRVPQDAEITETTDDDDNESVTSPHFVCRSCESTKETKINPENGDHTCQECGDTNCYGHNDKDGNSDIEDDSGMNSYPRYNMNDADIEIVQSANVTKEYHEGSGC